MDKKNEDTDIDRLIQEGLEGKLSEEDRQKLQNWREDKITNEQAYVYLEKVWSNQQSEPRYINYESLENRIIKEGFDKEMPTGKVVYLGYKIAAAIALLLGMTYLLFYYKAETPAPEISVVEVKKYNPAGQKSRIVLPDNSVVWLNSESYLTYQKGFNDSVRFIKLEGEAYFEVAKDAQRPFVVESGLVRTTALGTSFNIKHYPEEKETNITLLSGKVKVNASHNGDYMLSPNDQLVFDQQANLKNKNVIEEDRVSVWKDGIITFKMESFSNIIRTLERAYDVQIDTTQYSTRGWEYTGEFDNMSLELILRRIGFAEGFEFQVKGKKIILKNKTI